MVSFTIWALISCAVPRDLRHKEETNEFGAKIEYTYYLAEDGREVLHGWHRQKMTGFSLNTKYEHGKLVKSQGTSRSTDTWSLDDLASEENKRQKSELATPEKPSD